MYVSNKCSSPLPNGSQRTDTASLARSYIKDIEFLSGACWDPHIYILADNELDRAVTYRKGKLTTLRHLKYCLFSFLEFWPTHQKNKYAFLLNVKWLLTYIPKRLFQPFGSFPSSRNLHAVFSALHSVSLSPSPPLFYRYPHSSAPLALHLPTQLQVPLSPA